MSELPGFSRRQVAALFDLREQRLQYWSDTGFLTGSIEQDGRIYYSFRDLVAVKLAKALVDAGMGVRRVRTSLDALRARLPETSGKSGVTLDEELARLRVRCDGDRLIVDVDGVALDAETGQTVIDFGVASLQEEVAQVLSLRRPTRAPESAFEHFLLACEHEDAYEETGDEHQRERAVAQYERALALDPKLAPAWTNLGSLLVEMGDEARGTRAFESALDLDASLPEPRGNLAELALRRGDIDAAVAGFREALRWDAGYYEAHYGLARALIAADNPAAALAHLERYCHAAEREGLSVENEPRMSGVYDAIEDLRHKLRES